MDEIIKTGLRMMGHLLEHHPTTGWGARTAGGTPTCSLDTEATCWCFLGAAGVVEDKLFIRSDDLDDYAAEILGWHDKVDRAERWDNATDRQRLKWARQLQQVV